MKIKVEKRDYPTMIGMLKECSKPCPYGMTSMFFCDTETDCYVGSRECQMCKHFGGYDYDNETINCNKEI